MKGFIFVISAALSSGNVIAQQELNQNDKVYAELYASFVSHAAFVEVCSKFDAIKNYEKPFKKWSDKNKEDIAKGRAILTNHYNAKDIQIDKILSWKTDSEKSYFKVAPQQEKLDACNRLMTFISPSE